MVAGTERGRAEIFAMLLDYHNRDLKSNAMLGSGSMRNGVSSPSRGWLALAKRVPWYAPIYTLSTE